MSAPVQATGPIELLTKAEVLALLKCSHVTLWDWIRKGHFPASIVVGPGDESRSKMYWIKSEVDNFLANRPRRHPTGSMVSP